MAKRRVESGVVMMVLCAALAGCEQAPAPEELLARRPFPVYTAADFDLHPTAGIPVGKRHLIVFFAEDAGGAAIADALARARATVVGSEPELRLAYVTVPEDSGWAGLDAAREALSGHAAVSAVSHDLVVAPDVAPPRPTDTSFGGDGPGAWWTRAIGAQQAWNALPALRWVHERSPRTVHVGVIDTGFQDHADLTRVMYVPAGHDHAEGGLREQWNEFWHFGKGAEGWHGSFVAGLIGAEWNGRYIDGVVPHPFVRITAAAKAGGSASSDISRRVVRPFGESLVAAAEEVLSADSSTRVINISTGFNWYATNFTDPSERVRDRALELGTGLVTYLSGLAGVAARAGARPTVRICDPRDAPGGPPTGSRCDAAEVRRAIEASGRAFLELTARANRRRPLLFVVSAGNDASWWPAFPAHLSSPGASAGLTHGDPNTLVVGSVPRVETTTQALAEAGGSNRGAHILAPGVEIESLRGAGATATMTGTSYATPIVAGSAAFLLALNPGLTNAELRSLLTTNQVAVTDPVTGASTVRPVLHLRRAVEAMQVKLPGGGTVPGARLLADIDDGSDDGFTRLGRLPGPRTWERVEVDMKDMRAFRDMWWLTRPDGGVTLPCPVSVPMCDLNGDGRAAAPQEPHSRAALAGRDVDDAAFEAFRAQWTGDALQRFTADELRDLLSSADLKLDARAFLLEAATSEPGVDGLRVSLAGRKVDGRDANHAAIREIKLGREPRVLTTPGLRGPEIEVQVLRGDAPVGRLYRARLDDLQITEDRTLVLNPCAWESEPEISILEPWTQVDCEQDGTTLVHVNSETPPAGPPVVADEPDGRHKARSTGDPRIHTWDGMMYDFQGVGEYTLFTDGEVEIQARQGTWDGLGNLSVNRAIAARVGADRVVFRHGEDDRVWLNGQARDVTGGLALAGARVERRPRTLALQWDGGDVLELVVHPETIDAYLTLQPRPGRVYRGLLGPTPNGEPTDEFVGRDGVVYSSPDFKTLYHKYGESWRIAQADSLFDYGPGETTETFTDRAFPAAPVTIADLPPDVYAAAHARCSEANIRQPSLLEACIIDLARTGRDSAVWAFQRVPDPRATFRPVHARFDFETPPGTSFMYPRDVASALSPPITRAPGSAAWPATGFFGPFGDEVEVGKTPTLMLFDLPPHDTIELSFDLYVLGEWRGDAVVEVREHHRPVVRATYSTGAARQSFPGVHPGGDFAGGTGALARNALGLGKADAVFRHRVVFTHDDPALIMYWLARGVGRGRWGVDNVEVVTRTSSLVGEPVDVGGAVVTLQHGPALAPDRAGCADGTREAFHDAARHPDIAGCVAVWTGAIDLRAPATGAACGDGRGPCAVPADACAPGWHVCGGYDPRELRAVDAVACAHAGVGWFSGANSACLGDDPCAEPPASGPWCLPEGPCAAAFCCGTLCSPGPMECGPSATRLPRGPATCGQATSTPASGVLCCRG